MKNFQIFFISIETRNFTVAKTQYYFLVFAENEDK